MTLRDVLARLESAPLCYDCRDDIDALKLDIEIAIRREREARQLPQTHDGRRRE